MKEQLPQREAEGRTLSRRALLAGGIGMTVAAALRRIPDDIRLNAPSLEVHRVFAGRMPDTQLSGEDTITITPWGTLLYEPSGLFFTPGREFEYVHRGANSLEAIKRSVEEGANLLDLDANDMHGDVRGEHGIIPQVTLRIGRQSINLHFPGVIDVNEKELRLGMPSTYEELVAYVASLSTPDNPIAMSVELKRGEFEVETLEMMLGIHKKYNVPVIMHSPDSERLMAIGNKLAVLYNVPK